MMPCAAGRVRTHPRVGTGCRALQSWCLHVRKRPGVSDNVRMRLLNAFPPPAVLTQGCIVCHARAWRAKYNPGEEGSSVGFAFPSLCPVGSGWKGQDYSWFGVAPMVGAVGTECWGQVSVPGPGGRS